MAQWKKHARGGFCAYKRSAQFRSIVKMQPCEFRVRERLTVKYTCNASLTVICLAVLCGILFPRAACQTVTTFSFSKAQVVASTEDTAIATLALDHNPGIFRPNSSWTGYFNISICCSHN